MEIHQKGAKGHLCQWELMRGPGGSLASVWLHVSHDASSYSAWGAIAREQNSSMDYRSNLVGRGVTCLHSGTGAP